MSKDLKSAKTFNVRELKKKPDEIKDKRIFLMDNGIRYENKGGNSEGLAINYVPKFDKNGDGIVPHS